jgi:hypothetical protein
MGDDVTPGAVRALALADARVTAETLIAADSTYTQQDPIPGIPEDTSNPRSRMVLRATGSQAAGDALRLMVQRGGFAGTSTPAGYVYQQDGDEDDAWVGWDPPNALSGWQFVDFIADGAGTQEAQQPSLIRLPSGDLLCAQKGKDGGGNIMPRVRLFTAATGVWTSLGLITPNGTVTTDLWPTLCQLPSGRVLLYFWITSAAGEAQIEAWASDEDGDNFSLYAPIVLDEAIDTSRYDLRRIRAAADGLGAVLMVAQLHDNAPPLTQEETLVQWASSTDGVSFREIHRFPLTARTFPAPIGAVTDDGIDPDIIPLAGGGYLVSYASSTGTLGLAGGEGVQSHRVIGAAFDSLGDAAVGHVDDTLEDVVSHASWAGQDGTIFCALGRDGPTVPLFASKDGGATWDVAGAVTSTLEFLKNFTGAEARGRTVVCSEYTPPVDDHGEHSMIAVYLGGHTSLTRPADDGFSLVNAVRALSWSRTWIAIDEPDQFGWTKTTGPGPITTITTNGMESAGGIGEVLTYEIDTSNLLAEWIALIQANRHAGEFRIGVRVANGSSDHVSQVTFTGTRATLYDGGTGSLVEIDHVDLTASDVEILIASSDSQAAAWIREVSEPGEPERGGWLLIGQGALVAAGAPEAIGVVYFGAFADNFDVDFRTVCMGRVEVGAVGLSGGQTNPDDLFPRPFTATPSTLPGGLALTAVDGPGVREETFSIDTAYRYPFTSVDTASPRQEWRSANDDTIQTFIWALADADRVLLRNGLTVAFINTNIPRAEIAIHQDGGWVVLGDVSNGYGGGTSEVADIAYIRKGDTIIVDTGHTSSNGVYWLDRNELAGGSVILESDYVGTFGAARRLAGNSPGRWHALSDIRPVLRIHPDDYTGTEPTSGFMQIVFPSWVVTVAEPGEFCKLRIKVPIANTAEGHFRLGRLLVGETAVMGMQYSASRILELEPNTDLRTRRGGSRTLSTLGPPRRAVAFGWKEGVDTSQIHGLNPSPDYVALATNGEPQAARAATPADIEGMLYQNGRAPLLYLPRLNPRGTPPNVDVHFHRRDFLYGRVVSTQSREVVLGWENDRNRGEVQRVQETRIEEEL